MYITYGQFLTSLDLTLIVLFLFIFTVINQMLIGYNYEIIKYCTSCLN